VVLYSDGGGKRAAALRPIVGKDRIIRFCVGLRAKGASWFHADRVEPMPLNGLPGFVFHAAEGTETLAVEVADDAIVAIYAVRNPDKLRHLS